jgi:hypothetical protein
VPGQQFLGDQVQGPPANRHEIARSAEQARRAEVGALGGIRDAWREIREEQNLTYELGRQGAQQFVVGGLNQIADSLTGIFTGAVKAKDAVRSFFTGLLTDLARLSIQIALFSALGFGGGGGPTGLHGGVFGHGHQRMLRGGVARGPTTVTFAEGSRAEAAFIPLDDGRSVPVTLNGGRPMNQGPAVIINVYANDGADAGRFLTRNAATILDVARGGIVRDAGIRASIERVR